MTEPRRWLDDPDEDPELRAVLRGARAARLDDSTRRRLGAKVARASALPAVAAGWLFVKSAAAALGVVVGGASIASVTGVLDVTKPEPAALPARPAASRMPPRLVTAAPAPTLPSPAEPAPLNPVPSLPVAPPAEAFATAPSSGAPSSSARLAAESLLLEQARRELTRAPAVALQIAAEHRSRFAQAQLASERTLIEIEALHRLGRDGEARDLARGMASGGGIYAERVRQLLGEPITP